MNLLLACIAVTAGGAAALLVAEYKQSLLAKCIAKPLASTGFVALALVGGALQGAYGVAIVAALVLSWIGDVLLIARRSPWFRLGILAFLLAHVAFVVAFAVRGMSITYAAASLLVMAPVGVVVGRWLLGRVQPELRSAVASYIAVITVMVAAAAGTVGAAGGAEILLAALAFYVSDLSVALHRFVSPKLSHRIWGVPLYFGAQLLLAWSATRG